MFITVGTVEKFFETCAKIFAWSAFVDYVLFGFTAYGEWAFSLIISVVGIMVSLAGQIIIRRYY